MTESETIAIFGSTGNTGKEILAGALEKGYKVRIMVRNPAKLDESIKNNPDVTVFTGGIASTDAIKNTIEGSDYVISAVGGPLGKPEDFPTGDFLAFTKTVVEVMKDNPTAKVFLHQAGAFIPHPDGSHPLFMRMMNKVAAHPKLGGIGPNMEENDAIMKYMLSVQNDKDIKFKMIATRPGGLKKSAGSPAKRVELMGSDTEFPLGMTSFYDLGRFTVDAIKDKSLYGRFPFLVKKRISSFPNGSKAIAASAAVLAAYTYKRK